MDSLEREACRVHTESQLRFSLQKFKQSSMSKFMSLLSELTHSPLPACSALRKKGLSALVSALDSALPGTFVTKCLEVEVVEVSKLEQVFTFVNSYL